jgi:hypothetical protein
LTPKRRWFHPVSRRSKVRTLALALVALSFLALGLLLTRWLTER